MSWVTRNKFGYPRHLLSTPDKTLSVVDVFRDIAINLMVIQLAKESKADDTCH